ncbi:MAG: hypothetical protein RLZZ580_3216 [Cyanobacteriota bacterium]|jgi:hypothetical protein
MTEIRFQADADLRQAIVTGAIHRNTHRPGERNRPRLISICA